MPAGSDYGSDFDDDEAEELRQLLDSIELARSELPVFNVKDSGDDLLPVARVPASSASQHSQRSQDGPLSYPPLPLQPAHSEQELLDTRPFPGSHQIPHDDSPGKISWETEEPNPQAQDTRSPLQRFRTPPKKPLSVTDLISPAWCELQYWYNLINYGRIKPTVAMQRGSEVHKVLEEQVHHTVPVDVQTREDTWGLRIWNVIQGLRTLRITGMTRELELWGSVDGQVINGIIDEISFTCTDPELEDSIEKYDKSGTNEPQMSSDQATITEFFGSQGGGTSIAARMGALRAPNTPKNKSKIYITDVKTRGRSSLPSKAAMRPTFMQLMLYRRLLTDMACNRVDPTIMFERYRLNPEANFSDALIAQPSQLDFNFESDSVDDSYAPIQADTDVVMELLTHNSLNALWALMIEEFSKTIPDAVDSISKVLKVEYRSSKDGSIVGVKTFAYRDNEIESYLEDEMRWWRGEREAKGVEVEEAYKCRMCDFADSCTWRKNKIQDAVTASRTKRAAAQEATG